jgi:hypothetical protein
MVCRNRRDAKTGGLVPAPARTPLILLLHSSAVISELRKECASP